jgi:acyl-CoA dehydrogenase
MSTSSPFYSAEHAAFRDAMRRFVAREVTPHVEQWEADGAFPREL